MGQRSVPMTARSAVVLPSARPREARRAPTTARTAASVYAQHSSRRSPPTCMVVGREGGGWPSRDSLWGAPRASSATVPAVGAGSPAMREAISMR